MGARIRINLFLCVHCFADLEWYSQASVCVVMASGGYPGSYDNGKEITGFDLLKNLMDEDSTMLSPVDVDVDKKMNIFFFLCTFNLLTKKKNIFFFSYALCMGELWCL